MLTICHMFPYVLVSLRSVISLLCPILTHCDPRKSSIFPIFVIFVIYRPRFCPFVHFVIVLYCIYAFWDVNIISVIVLYIALYIALFDFVIALYIALRGTCREYTLVYGSTRWFRGQTRPSMMEVSP